VTHLANLVLTPPCDPGAEPLGHESPVAAASAGYEPVLGYEYPLPNGKTLVRQDFRPTGSAG
jgi:hypothetical protein